MTPKAFIEKALTHYTAHLAAETQQFGILAISDSLIENNSCRVVDDARDMWQDLAQQAGLNMYVGHADLDPQTVFAILSKEPIPRPNQTHRLWSIVQELQHGEDEADKIESLDLYDGPYKIEVPD